MEYNPDIHHRRSIRLKDYDYSRLGVYFLTLCLRDKKCLLGNIASGEMVLNDAGKSVQSIWNDLSKRFSTITLDKHIMMPNHMHGIIICRGEPCVRPESCLNHEAVNKKDADNDKNLGEHKVRPYGTLSNSLGRIVQAFKSVTTHEYIIGVKENGWPPFPGKLWQRNYYEHIVRNEDKLNKIREYIQNNPLRWQFDRENPERVCADTLEDEVFNIKNS